MILPQKNFSIAIRVDREVFPSKVLSIGRQDEGEWGASRDKALARED